MRRYVEGNTGGESGFLVYYLTLRRESKGSKQD